MTKKKESPQNSIKKFQPPNTGLAIQMLIDESYKELYPNTEATIQRLALSLVNFFLENPEAMYLNEFFQTYGIAQTYFNRLVNEWPSLENALKFTKDIIANKRLKRVGQFDSKVLLKDLYQYSESWKEVEEREDKRKKNISTQHTFSNFTIIDGAMNE